MNVASATAHDDAMTFGQDLRWQWSHAGLTADITSINSPHKIIFDDITEPSLAGVTPTTYWDTDHVLIDSNSAVYLVDIQLELLY